MWWRVDLDVHGPPQGNSFRCAVRRFGLLLSHEFGPPFRGVPRVKVDGLTSMLCVFHLGLA
jgi:hypothetical protein